MPGTKAGAKKRWANEKENRTPEEISQQFSDMGKKSHVGGFGANPELARQVKREYWDKKKAEQNKTQSKLKRILRFGQN